MRVRKELGAAVAAGKISEEDAVKRYKGAEKGIRERMTAGRRQRGDERRRITREDYARAEVEIRKAVAEGKISGEGARAHLGAMHRMMATPGGDRRAEYEGFERRIRAAVEAGKMTREEAGEKLEGYRRRMAMAEQGGDMRAEYEGFERRIKAAVQAGKMTREEAGEKLEAYRKRMGQEK